MADPFKVSGNVVPILDFSPKQIYQISPQQRQIAPTARQKLKTTTQIKRLIRKGEFQYKILNYIILTN